MWRLCTTPTSGRTRCTDASSAARARQRQLSSHRWQDDVDRALALAPERWDTIGFASFLRQIPTQQARWVMVRLLSHLQDGRCALRRRGPEPGTRTTTTAQPGPGRALSGMQLRRRRRIRMSPNSKPASWPTRQNPPADRFQWHVPPAESDTASCSLTRRRAPLLLLVRGVQLGHAQLSRAEGVV
jgi:hypothetical protein